MSEVSSRLDWPLAPKIKSIHHSSEYLCQIWRQSLNVFTWDTKANFYGVIKQ